MKKLLFILFFFPVLSYSQAGTYQENIRSTRFRKNIAQSPTNQGYPGGSVLIDSLLIMSKFTGVGTKIILADNTGKLANLGANTDMLSEGSNLFYTDARARNSISAGAGIFYNSTTGEISNNGVVTINGQAGHVNVDLFDSTAVYTAINAKLDTADYLWSTLPGKPSTFTPSSHTHVIADVPGLQTALNKIPVTYSGTTNASGEYSVTFPVAYSTVPNVQANIVNQSLTNQFIRVTAVSTTGFTINVFQRNSVTLLTFDVLLSSTVNVNGAAVHVIVTEQ